MARTIISVEDKKKRVAKSAAKKKNASPKKAAAKKHHLRIDILTAVPELLASPLNFSIVERAKKKGLVRIFIHNIRDYAKGKYKKVDDYSYGGEAGMVMMIEPVYTLITKLKKQRKYDEIIYLTPDGEIFNQQIANQLSLKKNIILLCGHYKGIDHRIREHLITREISIGDYVLSGGEIAAAAISDTIIRLLPGALSDETSALSDSFQDNLLSAPIYTRPADFKGWKVPEVLLSGNHDKIAQWGDEQALARTKKLRPDLLK
ncbi:MAG TPA: tRNA (guanosine(37)-N1)-methyltransferase TrmD [Candidatus Egerieousia sp.]|nr:tRNA (guanosine(37)-N1)-methyltransferase TrmD [Candidatus Egerieousia sp.]HPT06422.1 tRNA (guanosine(37)-N1)-methyltransferase TrmD [Candidatus Egerieousia sp.]